MNNWIDLEAKRSEILESGAALPAPIQTILADRKSQCGGCGRIIQIGAPIGFIPSRWATSGKVAAHETCYVHSLQTEFGALDA